MVRIFDTFAVMAFGALCLATAGIFMAWMLVAIPGNNVPEILPTVHNGIDSVQAMLGQ